MHSFQFGTLKHDNIDDKVSATMKDFISIKNVNSIKLDEPESKSNDIIKDDNEIIPKNTESIKTSMTSINNNDKDNSLFSIFNDNEKFEKLLNDKINKSNIIKPIDALELNSQLFCPLKNTSSNNMHYKALKMIYKNQYNSNCFDKNQKYLILNLKNSKSGLGATSAGPLFKIFLRALFTNRTFLIIGEWKWIQSIRCKNLNGLECYFIPISNCNVYDVLNSANYTNKSDIHDGGIPKDCKFNYYNISNNCQQRIVYFNTNKFSVWIPTEKTILSFLKMKGLDVDYEELKTIWISYLWRPNNITRKLLYNNIKDVYINDVNKYGYNINNTVGMPIRHSDKCRYNIKFNGVGAEMECWSKLELYNAMKSIMYFKPNINTFILTSEDNEFLNEYIHYINNNTSINVNIILNHKDTSPGAGNSAFIEDENLKFNIDKDIVIGGLTTMLLQVIFSKYIIWTSSSSWLRIMWLMNQNLSCESLFNVNNIDRYCIEFKQRGSGNKNVYWGDRVIIFPEIWKDIINIYNNKTFHGNFSLSLFKGRYCTYKPNIV